jgi:hypothetical protein
MSTEAREQLIARWREDAGGTYRTWFLWEDRQRLQRAERCEGEARELD